MESFQLESQEHFDITSEQLDHVESFLSEDSLLEIRTNHTSLLSSYQEDISGLAITDGEMDCLVERLPDENYDGLDCLRENLPEKEG